MEHARTTGPSARAALGQARGDSGRHWKFREEAPTSEMDSQGAGAGVQRKDVTWVWRTQGVHGNRRGGRAKESTWRERGRASGSV